MSESGALGANTTPVAFFDFDGTLTTCDTLMPFLKFVVGRPKYYWNLLLVSPVLIGYFLKLVRNDIAKEAVLKRYLEGYHIDELFSLGERFSKDIIPTLLRPEGMERLKWHQEQGHDCVLVSASFDIWLTSWIKDNDINYLISSELSFVDNKVIGKLKNNNCHGEEKVIRIMSYLGVNLKNITYAYGDTEADMHMILFVKYGYIWTGNGFVLVEN